MAVRSKVEQNSAEENQLRTASSGLLTERINVQELPPAMWALDMLLKTTSSWSSVPRSHLPNFTARAEDAGGQDNGKPHL